MATDYGNDRSRNPAATYRRGGTIGTAIIGAVMLLLVALLLWAVFYNDDSTDPESGASLSEIVQAPNTYAGQTVTVRSEVEQVVSQVAFWLDEDALLDGSIDDDLLVVSATQDAALDFETLEGNGAIVTGTVRQFDRAAIEQEIGYDLDDALFADLAGRPVIIATAVEPVVTE
jgi:hypothetical protein